MNGGAKPVWLGFHRTGGRMCLDPSDLRPGVNVVGPGSGFVAAGMASACREAGMKTFVIDLEGDVARRLEGRFVVRGYGGFLYDSQRMEEKASLHAELAASAYTLSLNLSFEQEGFLNSAMQYIAMEGGVASPSSLADRLSEAGEFRGHTADELRGKLLALRTLNMTGREGVVREMLLEGAVADFSGAESRQAGEVAAMVLMAKVLAIAESGGALPDVLVVTGANRIFTDMPLTRHGNRLLTALLAADMSRVLASETTYGLDRNLPETSPVAILSSSVEDWGAADRFRRGARRESPLVFTPNMFLLRDLSRGSEVVFLPRDLVRMGQPAPQEPEREPAPEAGDGRVDRKILETLSQHDNATRGSVVGFLSAEDPRGDLEAAIDRLQAEGYLEVVGKDVRRDSPLQTYRLTKKGYDLLRSLS